MTSPKKHLWHPLSSQDQLLPSRSAHRCGITVIELLVSVVIITILAVFSITGFNMARQKADDVGCTSNLMKIGLAARMYASDHNQSLPGLFWFYQPEGNKKGAMTTYLGFTHRDIEKNSVLTCMANQRRYPVKGFVYHRTYTMNRYMASLDRSEVEVKPMTQGPWKYTEIEQPARTAFFMDGSITSSFQNERQGWWHATEVTPSTPGAHWGDANRYPHRGGLHVLFIDGHVSRVSQADILLANRLIPDRVFWRGSL